MAEEQFDPKKVEAGIANVSSVIKSIVKNKKSIVNASKDFAEIIKIMAATAKALDSPEAKKAITVSGDISKVLGSVAKAVSNMTKPIEQINAVNSRSLWRTRIKIKKISRTIKRVIKHINRAFRHLNNIRLKSADTGMTLFNSLISKLSDTIQMIRELNTRGLKRKTRVINNSVDYIKRIIESIKRLTKAVTKSVKSAAPKMKLIQTLIATYVDVIKKIAELKLKDVVVARVKIKVLSMITRPFKEMVRGVVRFTRIKGLLGAVVRMQSIWMLMASFGKVIFLIKTMKTMFLRRKIKIISKAIKPLRGLIHKLIRLTKMRGIKKAAMKMLMLRLLFSSFRHILISAIVLAPISMLFVALSPIIILCLWLAVKVLKILLRILARMVIGPGMMITRLAILGLLALNFMLIILGLSVLALALIAVPTIMALPVVLLFMLGMIALVIILCGFGLLMEVAAPLLMAAALGVLLVTVAVLCIVVIALLLLLLQDIQLDMDKIKENVKKVFKTASMVILWVAEPIEGEDKLKQDNPEEPEPGIWDILGNGIMKVVGALIGAVALLGILIAVAAVLLIALCLRLIQNLDLDSGRILANVAMCFDIGNAIIMFISTPYNIMPGEEEDGETIRTMATATSCDPLLKVVECLLAAVGLVAVAIGVLAVLLIATMLRLLQNLDLDENKIMRNVQLVFKISSNIIDSIAGNTDTNKDGKKKSGGLIWMLITYVIKPLAKIIQAILALAYLIVILVAIAAVLLIASLLRLLQNIDLKEDKIRENVKLVLKISRDIIKEIFSPEDEGYWEGAGRMGLLVIVKWVLPQLSAILDAIFALAYLALMVLAIACVLLIAGLLRLLQDINLDEETIKQNVRIVIQTCQDIINQVFQPDTANSEQSGRGLLISFVKWVMGEGFARIFEAMTTIAFLALMAIAILIVLGLAALLRLLQEIELDEGKVQQNVNIVMETCQSIVNKVLGPDDASKEGSSRGLLLTFVKWVSPEFGRIFEAILTIAYLALMMIAMIIVLGLAKMLKQIGDIDESIMQQARRNVDSTLDTAMYIIMGVFKDDSAKKYKPKEEKSFLRGVIKFVAGEAAAQAYDALCSLAHLGVMYLAINIILMMADALANLGKYDTSKIVNASRVTDAIIDALKYVTKRVYVDLLGYWESFYENDKDRNKLMDNVYLESSLQALRGAIQYLSTVADDLETLVEHQTNSEIVKTVVNNIFESIKTIIGTAQTFTADVVTKAVKDLQMLLTNLEPAIVLMKQLAEHIAVLGDVDVVRIENAAKNIKGTFESIGLIIDYSALSHPKTGWMFRDNPSQWEANAASFQQALLKTITQLAYVGKIIEYMIPLINKIYSLANTAEVDATALGQRLGTVLGTMRTLLSSIWMANREGVAESLKNYEDTYLTKQMENPNTYQLGKLVELIGLQIQTLQKLTDLVMYTGVFFRTIATLAEQMNQINSIQFDISNLVSNVPNLFNCLYGLIKQMTRAGENADWDTIAKEGAKAVTAIGVASAVLTKYTSLPAILRQAVDSTTSLNIDENAVENNATKAKAALRHMFSIIKAADISTNDKRVRANMDLMDRINQSITSFTHVTSQDVENSKDLTDNYIAFLTKVNTMDYTKLKTTEQLMKHWADMSKSINGNFQGLARAINEYIAPVLEDLNKTMEESVKVQKQIIEDLQKPIEVSQLANSGGGAPASGGTPTDSGGSNPSGSIPTSGTVSTQTGQPTGGGSQQKTQNSQPKQNTGDGADLDLYEEEDDGTKGTLRKRNKEEGINDDSGLPDFLNPYGPARGRRRSAIDRCIEGDALRVKIVN